MQQRTDDPTTPDFAWAYVVSRLEGPGGTLHRAGVLTSYVAQMILEDARRARRDTRLEVTLPARAADPAVARLAGELRHLAARGARLSVRHAGPETGGRTARAPHAAA